MRKSVSSTWGVAKPPIIRELQEQLLSVGFSENWYDEGSGFFLWRRVANDDLVVDVSLCPRNASHESVEFDSFLFVASHFVRQIQTQIKIWECAMIAGDSLVDQNELEAGTAPVKVLGVNLEWLKWNEKPEDGPFWWRVELGDEAQVARNWLGLWNEYGEPFVKRVDTSEKLVGMLLNLGAYPKRVRINGLRCADRSVYAAILLYHIGRKKEAVEVVESMLEDVRASVSRGEIQKIAEEFARCKMIRLREVFRSQ